MLDYKVNLLRVQHTFAIDVKDPGKPAFDP